MIKAYDYYGFIDLDAEDDDTFTPYEECPICFHDVSPADSELIYQNLCFRCSVIIHTIYSYPHHPICESIYIPGIDDSTQVLGLIKMRLYNMIESFAHETCIDSIEIIKELMEQTPADFKMISQINAVLIPILVTRGFSRHRISSMLHTALGQGYINLETAQSLNRRISYLILDGGRTTND